MSYVVAFVVVFLVGWAAFSLGKLLGVPAWLTGAVLMAFALFARRGGTR